MQLVRRVGIPAALLERLVSRIVILGQDSRINACELGNPAVTSRHVQAFRRAWIVLAHPNAAKNLFLDPSSSSDSGRGRGKKPRREVVKRAVPFVPCPPTLFEQIFIDEAHAGFRDTM